MLTSLRSYFLLDGAGALISAVCLGLVLPGFPAYFGTPTGVLHFLSGIAVALLLFDLGSYVFGAAKSRRLLQLVISFNLGYALLSGALVLYHYAALRAGDLLYFGGEILILLWLVRIEWRAANSTID